jgi:hypothetical protein
MIQAYESYVLVCENTEQCRRTPSPGIWRRAGLLQTDVSEEHVVSIFMAEEIGRARKRVC